MLCNEKYCFKEKAERIGKKTKPLTEHRLKKIFQLKLKQIQSFKEKTFNTT